MDKNTRYLNLRKRSQTTSGFDVFFRPSGGVPLGTTCVHHSGTCPMIVPVHFFARKHARKHVSTRSVASWPVSEILLILVLFSVLPAMPFSVSFLISYPMTIVWCCKKIRKFRWLQNCFGTLQEFWSEFCLKTPLDISKLWNSYWIFVRWIWNSWRISIRILVENIVTNPSDDSGIFNRILIRILVGNAALENYGQLRNS